MNKPGRIENQAPDQSSRCMERDRLRDQRTLQKEQQELNIALQNRQHELNKAILTKQHKLNIVILEQQRQLSLEIHTQQSKLAKWAMVATIAAALLGTGLGPALQPIEKYWLPEQKPITSEKTSR